MKPLGISIWIWCVGVTLTAGFAVAALAIKGTLAENHRNNGVLQASEACFKSAQACLRDEWMLDEAESQLDGEKNPGRAQLYASKRNEAKEKAEASKSRFDTAFTDLQKIEGQTSGKFTPGSDCAAIDEFMRRGRKLIWNSRVSAIRYKEVHPDLIKERNSLFQEMTFDEVKAARYKR